MSKIYLLKDRVMVRLGETGERKTSGGIVIPEVAEAKDQVRRSEVVAVGPGVKAELKAGNEVLHRKWAGSEYKIGKDRFMIMREGDLIAILI